MPCPPKNLGMNEIMFAQGMIPHHQQAIDMSNMALKNGASPEVTKLAKGIIAAQGKEISQLKYWLTATKSSMTMGHDMGMGGMIRQVPLSSFADIQYINTYGGIKRKQQKRIIIYSI